MKSRQADNRAATLDSGESRAPATGSGDNSHEGAQAGAGTDPHDRDAVVDLHKETGTAPSAGRRVMKFAYTSGSKPLAGYTIKRGIGIGGFGEVYFALSDAGKEVALKRIQRNLDVELRGVRQCLNLKHINLISLWDIATNDLGESWVVMEYVPGQSLMDVVDANPQGVPEADVKTWFTSTAAGVAYLHEQGIVHRDLKPANIFFDADQQVIKIGDYGLSKFISCSRKSGQTESVGTFHYMAPEIGKGVYGKEIDIYAMGIILFELLTGRVPFDGESSQEIIMKHLTADPILEGVPREFHQVIRGALGKDPEQRYSNVPEMLCDIPWPEIAKNSRKIITLNSVGPLVLNGHMDRPRINTGNTPGPANKKTAPHSPTENPQDAGTQDTNPPDSTASGNQGPVGSMLINKRPDIIFGELRDTNAGNKPSSDDPVVEGIRISSPGRNENISAEGTYRESLEVSATVEIVSPTSISHHSPGDRMAGNATGGISRIPDEPIARAMHSGLWRFTDWWNNANVSTPLKIAILIAGTVVAVSNSDWLLPAALAIGLAYLVYFFFRTWMIPGDKVAQSGTGIGHPDISSKKKSVRSAHREAASLRNSQVRSWLGARQWNDRVMELLGSMLIAAAACVVFNLLGLAIGGSILVSTIESWAMFAWMTITTVFGAWALLMAGKYWENYEGDNWLRRVALGAIGIATGTVAFSVAGMLNIELASLSVEYNPMQATGVSLENVPALPAYLVLFTVLFAALGWWKQTDPVRYTRLSIWNVGLCLVCAAVLSHLLNFAPLWNCIMAVVISIAVQLASPWLHPDDRTRVSQDRINTLAG